MGDVISEKLCCELRMRIPWIWISTIAKNDTNPHISENSY